MASTLQSRVLDSVLEDQEPAAPPSLESAGIGASHLPDSPAPPAMASSTSQSSPTTFPISQSQQSQLPALSNSMTSVGRRLSFTRRQSIPALAAAAAANAGVNSQNQSADTLQSATMMSHTESNQGLYDSTHTVNPGLNSRSRIAHHGQRGSFESQNQSKNVKDFESLASSIVEDELLRKKLLSSSMSSMTLKDTDAAGALTPAATVLPKKKKGGKYNVPASERLRIPKEYGKASVGYYDPYPIKWQVKDVKNRDPSKDVWTKMVPRFKETVVEEIIGPGIYNPRNQNAVVNMGAMVFKSNVPRFKKRPIASELNPNVGPGVYSVGSLLKGKIQVKDTDAAIRVMQLDIKTEKRGYVPWVKNLQTSLSRVVDFKEPLVPIPHIQLIAEASDMAEMTSPGFARRRTKEIGKRHDESVVKREPIKASHHPLDINFLVKSL